MTLHVRLIVLMASAVWMARGTAQPLPPVTDSDAYAIYGVLLDSQLWRDRGDQRLFVVQETRLQRWCRSSKPVPEVWRPAQADMERQNARTWKLLATKIRHSLVPRPDLEADDARLRQKHPGRSNHLPGSMEFAEFSAVGFSPDRTKAMLYGRTRSAGGLYVLERTDGRWVVSSAWGCRWAA
jgi:hypothetical protein